MIRGEDITAKRGRNDDEKEGTTVSRNVLTKSEAAIQERDRTRAEVFAVGRMDYLEIFRAPCGWGIGGGQAEMSDNLGRVKVGVVG